MATNERTTWTTWGPVRGQCRHRHKTVETAVRCVQRDRIRAQREGVDSDRSVWRIDDLNYLRGSTGEHALDAGGAHVRFEEENDDE